jgi:hypothetical protein
VLQTEQSWSWSETTNWTSWGYVPFCALLVEYAVPAVCAAYGVAVLELDFAVAVAAEVGDGGGVGDLGGGSGGLVLGGGLLGGHFGLWVDVAGLEVCYL